METGPFRMKDESTLIENPTAWNEFANILFGMYTDLRDFGEIDDSVDQPVGTGFSYINTDNYLHDLDQVRCKLLKPISLVDVFTYGDVFNQIFRDISGACGG